MKNWRTSGIHFFDRIAIYGDKEMAGWVREHWRGYDRMKWFSIGSISVWTRGKKR